MADILKSILGFFTGRTPEYVAIIASIKEMGNIMQAQKTAHEKETLELRRQIREAMQREEESHKKILELETTVARLTIELDQLKARINERTDSGEAFRTS